MNRVSNGDMSVKIPHWGDKYRSSFDGFASTGFVEL